MGLCCFASSSLKMPMGIFDGPTKDPFSASADIYVMVSEYKHVQSYSYLHLYRGLR